MYKLPVWEVQLREADGKPYVGSLKGQVDGGRTVWVRRKQKIG